MSTVLYFIRHSEVYSKSLLNNIQNGDSFQNKNEKSILSVAGEVKAHELSEHPELQNIDAVYSSNYSRCIGTAKYIADKNDVKINIDDRLNERLIGDTEGIDWYDYHKMQLKDFDYKRDNGESLNDTKKRMVDAVKNILMFETDNRVAVVSHSTALTCLLSAWCDVGRNYHNDVILSFKDDTIVDGYWTAPMVFKVEFDGMNVLSIEVIENGSEEKIDF